MGGFLAWIPMYSWFWISGGDKWGVPLWRRHYQDWKDDYREMLREEIRAEIAH